jgi:hypothetical protein|tara:strand:- start:360 stop:656 length:297 start_codon:yes stop_codon:yes gene_type:complete
VAVLLHGLQRGVTATQLRKLLEADLATLGFAAADVDHIEVGRQCAREVALLETLAQLATAEPKCYHDGRRRVQPSAADTHNACARALLRYDRLFFQNG